MVMDVDGTLTNGKIYMGETGEVFKAFDVKDGCGIHDLLPRYNIVPIIITARSSQILMNRCKELDVKELHQGIRDKLECLLDILEKYHYDVDQLDCLRNVAYIGDDILDIPCMKKIKENTGIIGCPADACKSVKKISDFISEKDGGNGAVRDFIEYVIGIEENNGWQNEK